MCYVCNCFSWTLDLVQRTITFCLACCTACVICCGLIITSIAGIAYGYNYSFAEFITHTKSDVTVYLRRGQFYDNPDLVHGGSRRMGDEDYDALSSNINSDGEERDIINKDSTPLSDRWIKNNDAQEYARKLTKYSKDQSLHINKTELKEQQKIQTKLYTTLPSIRRLSKIPISIPTTIWRTGSSEIIMRNFLPLNDITEDFPTKAPEDYFYKQDDHSHDIKPSVVEYKERHMEPLQPDIRIRVDDIPERKLMPINNNAIYPEQTDDDKENFPDIEDEDSIMYKPV